VRPFACHYDSIYCDKDYDNDVDVLKALIPSTKPYTKLLEIGAGTGNHTCRLAKFAEMLVSLEIDEDFLQLAKAKTSSATNLTLLSTPIERLPAKDFEGVVCFFNVLNYIPHERLADFVRNAGDRQPSGGWFVADLWNGNAVLAEPPQPETRVKRGPGIVVRQAILPTLDAVARMVTLDYDIQLERAGNTQHFQESLQMFLPSLDTVNAAFRSAGYNAPSLCDRRNFPERATAASWQVWLHATKK